MAHTATVKQPLPYLTQLQAATRQIFTVLFLLCILVHSHVLVFIAPKKSFSVISNPFVNSTYHFIVTDVIFPAKWVCVHVDKENGAWLSRKRDPGRKGIRKRVIEKIPSHGS